jgi:hypothetical protein
MKKLHLFSLIAFLLCTVFAVAGNLTPETWHLASLTPHIPVGMAMAGIATMTPEQILSLVRSDFSGLDGATGKPQLGYKSPELNYFGDKDGSLVNAKSQPFGIKITNSKDADRSFYLSAGNNGSIKGALVAGAFAAIDDTGTDTSLTAVATVGTQSINDLIDYARNMAPLFIPEINFIASDPNAFLGTSLEIHPPYNPLLPTQPATNISLSDAVGNTRGDLHLEFQKLRAAIFIARQSKVKFTIPANSYVIFNLNVAVAYDIFKAFQDMITKAAAAAVQNPELAQAVSNAQDVKRLQDKGILAIH